MTINQPTTYSRIAAQTVTWFILISIYLLTFCSLIVYISTSEHQQFNCDFSSIQKEAIYI